MSPVREPSRRSANPSLSDVLVLGIGVAIGAGGIALILAIGAAIIRLLGGPFSGLASGP